MDKDWTKAEQTDPTLLGREEASMYTTQCVLHPLLDIVLHETPGFGRAGIFFPGAYVLDSWARLTRVNNLGK